MWTTDDAVQREYRSMMLCFYLEKVNYVYL